MVDAIAAPGAPTPILAPTYGSIESGGSFFQPGMPSEMGPISPELPIPILSMREIPLPHERSPLLEKHSQVKAVMGHQLKHVLAARGKGYNVLDVTARPGDGHLGLTRFAGHIDPADYGVIAAAGSLSTPFGAAEGFGSDLRQAQIAAHQTKQTGIEGFISNAQAIDKQFPNELQKKMIDIMVYMERVMGMPAIPGYMMDAIYERATIELVLESSNQMWNPHATESMHTFVDQITTQFDEQHKQYLVERDMHDQTYVSDRGDGTTDFVTVAGGYITEVTNVCNRCGGHNGQHAAYCEAIHPDMIETGTKTPDQKIIFGQPFEVGSEFPDGYKLND